MHSGDKFTMSLQTNGILCTLMLCSVLLKFKTYKPESEYHFVTVCGYLPTPLNTVQHTPPPIGFPVAEQQSASNFVWCWATCGRTATCQLSTLDYCAWDNCPHVGLPVKLSNISFPLPIKMSLDFGREGNSNMV